MNDFDTTDDVSVRMKAAAAAIREPDDLSERIVRHARERHRQPITAPQHLRPWLVPLTAAAAVVIIAAGAVGLDEFTDHAAKHVPSAVSSPTPVTPEPTAVATPEASPEATTSPTPDAVPTQTPTQMPTATPVLPTPRPSPVYTLDTDGYGPLKLGMTRSQALATGLIASIDPASACSYFAMKGAGQDAGGNVMRGVISATLGVVLIPGPVGAKTAKGIGVGSTMAAVEAAYPAISYGENSGYDGGPFVPTSSVDAAKYAIPVSSAHTVTSISLEMTGQDCFG